MAKEPLTHGARVTHHSFEGVGIFSGFARDNVGGFKMDTTKVLPPVGSVLEIKCDELELAPVAQPSDGLPAPAPTPPVVEQPTAQPAVTQRPPGSQH